MKKILFIEDEKQLQENVSKKLSAAGYEMIQAFDGKEGIEKAMAQKPNLVLLDIILPGGMNGFDVMEQLKQREETKNIPFMILTNLDSEAKTARNMGAVDYIIKTNISLEALAQKVKIFLGG